MQPLSVRPFWFTTRPNLENAPIDILPVHNCSSIVPRNNSPLPPLSLPIINPKPTIKNSHPLSRSSVVPRNDYPARTNSAGVLVLMTH
jgi:hypothetical protein